MCTCLRVCLCTTCALGACGSHRRASDPLELKLQWLLATMSVLRTEPGFSGKVASDLQHHAITKDMGMKNSCLYELSILLLFARPLLAQNMIKISCGKNVTAHLISHLVEAFIYIYDKNHRES